MKHRNRYLISLLCYLLVPVFISAQPSMEKVRDLIIYKDSVFYSTFPSVVKKKDGEIIVAFRRAPDRRIFGESGYSHIDLNSYLVLVRSQDNGSTWSPAPELMYAHAFGGSQDPCLIQLKDGSLICTSYGWTKLNEEGLEKFANSGLIHGNAVFLGGYYLKSSDGGRQWDGPFYPPPVSRELRKDPLGKAVPAYNRGAMCQGQDGRIYWAVAVSDDSLQRAKTAVYLMVSHDRGDSWETTSLIASDSQASFNETSIYETPKGDVVAFLRTAAMDDQACIARSKDGGKSFGPYQKMGFQGHPFQATRLPDNRVLLVYGYRHEPFGVRARILDAECTNYETAEEIIIRSDGGSTDLGYPWATVLDDNRVLIVYYFNKGNSTRYIAGTIMQINE